MQEKEQEKRDKRKRDLEELIAKREAALVFAKNEEEKMKRRRAEAHKLSKVHIEQAVSGHLTKCISSKNVEKISA